MNIENSAATPFYERIDAVEVHERLSWPNASTTAYCDTWLMVNAGALNFKVSKEQQVAAMANIGHQLLQEIAAYRPAFAWAESPVEVIGALIEDATLCDAARDVLAERRRQQKLEGWTAEHDDGYQARELATAAGCYALHSHSIQAPPRWPWSPRWWKPTTQRQNYVKAAALLMAEIERIDRADTAAKGVA